MQDKVRQITCPFPDDLILQVFISQLANKVEMRKTSVQACLERTRAAIQHQQEIHANIKGAEQLVDQSTVGALQNFVREHKPRVEQLRSEIARIEQEHAN